MALGIAHGGELGAGPLGSPSLDSPATGWDRLRQAALIVLGAGWLVFQFAIVARPGDPLIERSLHLAFALALVILAKPFEAWQPRRVFARLVDLALFLAVLATAAYYYLSAERLASRIEMVDDVFARDIVFGILLVVLLLEGVRRAVGWSLLGLLLFVVFYAAAGPWFPGWSRFRGFGLEETIEMLTMTTNGVLGITTETSVQFVFYFVLFGAVFGAIGGGRLFIDIGLALSGRHQGGAAKAAVVSSSLMGTISGSAVANVVSVGVFTIPLMRRSGYSAEAAAGIEAISSTGGQLMPPVMGVAAFVMAELLQIDYGRVAFAAIIPALSFYFALFLVVDLGARRTGIGTLPPGALEGRPPIVPRLYLLIPPVTLVALLIAGYSATIAAVAGVAACPVTCYLRRQTRLGARQWLRTIGEAGRQASQVAVPIAAIGIIIAVAMQSNLALKFSTRLIEGGGANVYAALLLTLVGCIVMGMGLPTVAAYIIGAILFVPPLLKLGIAPLAAHFFVMYYCVLSMVTPPVALASFAAAGLAGAGTMQASWHAFRLSLVLFLIPLAFVFDPRLLGQGPLLWVVLAFLSTLAATAAWAVALVGYLGRPLGVLPRVLYGAAAVAVILFPTGSRVWAVALAALGLLFVATLVVKRLAHAKAIASQKT